jgi:AcrR family transcriptional regulator
MNSREKRKQKYEKMRKNEMINAAELLFLEKSFDETKMKAIADKAGYAKGTLYNYFSSKEDLFIAVVVKAYQKLIDLTERAIEKNEPGLNQLLAVGSAYYKLTKEFPRYANLLHDISQIEPDLWTKSDRELTENEKEYKLINQQYAKAFISVIEGAKKKGEIVEEISSQMMAIALASMTSGLLRELEHRKELINMSGIDIDEIIDFIFNIVKKGLEKLSK